MRSDFRIFVLTVIIALICSPHVFGQFAGGSGTAEDPWQVATIEHLDNVRNYLSIDHRDKYFIQISDIDASGVDWEPIGRIVQDFMGTFNGDGYTISNLMINRPEEDYSGLFGSVHNANISNLTLDNVQVEGNLVTGSLIGRSQTSTVNHISVTGTIQGNDANTGGIIGAAFNGGIYSQLNADVNVIGTTEVGGIFGTLIASARYSYSEGTVTGLDKVGGFVGRVSVTAGVADISDCYSTADVTGTDMVGGFAGKGASIYRSYSVGSVTGATNAGGFVGSLADDGIANIQHSYWDIETSGKEQSAGDAGVMGLSTEQMQQKSTYVAFNFYSAWQIEDEEYPKFQSFTDYALPQDVDLDDLSGTGTEQNPYIITSVDELNAMRQNMAAHYILDNDLDLTASVAWNRGRGWIPVGSFGSTFSGTFDGNGKTIKRLTANNPNYGGISFLGNTNGARISNLILEKVEIHGGWNSGGLVGIAAQGSQVENVTVTGSIVGNYINTGGILGNAYNGKFKSLFSDADVIGIKNVGGVFGSLRAESRNSYSKGTVKGIENVGGFVGETFIGSVYGFIEDCYSMADVIGVDKVGGFAGEGWNISRAYSTGAVSGETNAGGLIGIGGSIAESYWNMETSGQETSAGGEGRTTAQMTYPYDTGMYEDWDFDTIWAHDTDHSLNAGYPFIGEGLPTSTENEEDVPRKVKLHQNYPNPFNPVTNISYELPQRLEVRLDVYNVLGRRVAILASGSQPAGSHMIQFDASRLASGVYLYRLQAGSVVQTHKMMLIK